MLIRDLNKRQSIHPSIQSMKKIKDFFLLQKWQFFAQSLQMLIVEQKKYMWSGIEFYILGNTFGCQMKIFSPDFKLKSLQMAHVCNSKVLPIFADKQTVLSLQGTWFINQNPTEKSIRNRWNGTISSDL